MNIPKSGGKYILAFILLIPIVFTLSCAGAPAQTSTLVSSSPDTTVSSTVPGIGISPTNPVAPSTTETSAGIMPDWEAPVLSNDPLPADLSDIVARVLPSVVSINVEVVSKNIFGYPTTQQGAGSGWIIDPNGFIVTNNHVIQGAQNVTVSLHDGRSFPAQKISADPISDLAVIKINATGLPTASLGNSSKLKQGMMVTAIGNSLGQGIRVTAGWVSRLGVSLSLSATATEPGGTLFDLIETSAPINQGNSGGPLVDMLGEVVGITNAKLVATGVEAVGYAISTQTALPILEQLIQTGQVIRPYLGVSFQDNTPMIASVYGFAVDSGAIITQVDPTGPAGQAGLRPGDIIISMNGTEITSTAEALEAILTSDIGDRMVINFYRGDIQSTVQVTLTQDLNP